MKIYLAHAGNYDYETELYAPLKTTLAKKHDIFFPHDPANKDTKTKDIIAASDVVLAEVSHPSTGQGIELGWADAHGTPIICLYKTGTNPSGSLRFLQTETTIEYTDAQDMITKLQVWLTKQS